MPFDVKLRIGGGSNSCIGLPRDVLGGLLTVEEKPITAGGAPILLEVPLSIGWILLGLTIPKD